MAAPADADHAGSGYGSIMTEPSGSFVTDDPAFARLVPAPTQLQPAAGRFLLDDTTTVDVSGAGERTESLLRKLIGDPTGLPLRRGERADLTIRVDDGDRPDQESYRLDIDGAGVRIAAAGEAGALHAVQTLRQLLPVEVYGSGRAPAGWWLPAVHIQDRPRFPWRGGHLDVGRHFMPVEVVLRFIDLLAMHKYNVLHLHLTEDQGWRLQIDAYPLLTEIGSRRPGTMIGDHRTQRGSDRHDGVVHEGYYTGADARAIVAHAAARGVTVVPEIEMPGHAQAAIAAYPWLGNLDRQLPVMTSWGISEHILNVDDRTLAFCTEVLDEVCELFPSRFIHVGGDECPTVEWQQSGRAQQRMRSLGLADETALHGWFLGRIGQHLRARGRRLIGWDEMGESALAEDAVLMSWRGEQGGIDAARAGHDVIMTPSASTYFDYYQGDPAVEPLAMSGPLDLLDVYRYQPIPPELEPAAHQRILGSQFQLWTEYIPTPEHLEYMAFPRACALAEVLWTGRADETGFLQRLPHHLTRLDQLGINYRRG